MQRMRQSNIELLRIVAMLMVMIVHANYWRVGIPTASEAVSSPLPVFVRIAIQHFASPCVDVFIIISGYFTMRPKLKSLLNLWFLLAFWIGAGVAYSGFAEFPNCILRVVFPFFGWFIPAYLGLYLISPILNAYAENADKKALGKWLFVFFVLQSVFDFVYPKWEIAGRTIFNHGCSVLSFSALYLLGQYLKQSVVLHDFGVKKWLYRYLLVFGGSALCVFVLLYLAGSCQFMSLGAEMMVKWVCLNSSPVVIFGSVCLFMVFLSWNFTSRLVNIVAASALAVFCFHSMGFYERIVKRIYSTYSGVTVLLLDAGFIVAVFVAAVVIDQVRIALWKGFCKYGKII